MKKCFWLLTMSLTVTLLAVSQFGCATPPRNTSNANMATPEATPDRAAIEKELLRIENDWPRALKERDAEAIRRVEADDIVEIIPDGSLTSKAQDVADMQAGTLSADSWEIADAKVTILDSDAAFVSGRSIIKGGKVKGPDGKTTDISGEYRFIDTFARRDGQWKLVGSAAVKIQQTGAASTKPSPLPSVKASPYPTAKPSPTAKASPTARASPTAKMPPPPPAKKTPLIKASDQIRKCWCSLSVARASARHSPAASAPRLLTA